MYRSNYQNYNWDNDFKNSISNSISVDLELDKIFDIHLGLISVKNQIQFEKLTVGNSTDLNQYSIIPVQHDGNLDVLKIRLARKVNFGKF